MRCQLDFCDFLNPEINFKINFRSMTVRIQHVELFFIPLIALRTSSAKKIVLTR